MTVFEKMPGEKVTLFSTDTADSNDADDLHAIPAKYLQSLNSSGLPPSQLELKVDAPVMLLRNIDPASGLCNGTRLIVVHIGQYLLRVRLAHKPNTPNETIPRFTLSSQEGDMPFMLTRNQFSIRLCFANDNQQTSITLIKVCSHRPQRTIIYAWSAICRSNKSHFSVSLWHINPFTREYKYNQQCYLSKVFAEIIYALCPTMLMSLFSML
ncbi:unnamed protein product [Rhizopus microsporus]